MSHTITLYVGREDNELELEVSGTVSAFVPAVTHLPPELCHPAEGGEVKITSITFHGKKWNGELTNEELERVEEGLFEAARDDSDIYDDYEDDDLIIEEIF